MKTARFILIVMAMLWGLVLFPACSKQAPREGEGEESARSRVVPGCEVFLRDHLDLVEGKKVGLVTNPTGVDSGLRSVVDRFPSTG